MKPLARASHNPARGFSDSCREILQQSGNPLPKKFRPPKRYGFRPPPQIIRIPPRIHRPSYYDENVITVHATFTENTPKTPYFGLFLAESQFLEKPQDSPQSRINTGFRGSAPGWDRTSDHRIRSPVLYPLSYGCSQKSREHSRKSRRTGQQMRPTRLPARAPNRRINQLVYRDDADQESGHANPADGVFVCRDHRVCRGGLGA